MGKLATSPLPSQGSPPLQSWGAESELAHLWARWLHNPCRLGDPHRLRAGGRIRKRPTSGQDGYITPLGAFGACWLIPLTTNCRPEAPRGGGGGVVGVLGPAESPPPGEVGLLYSWIDGLVVHLLDWG